MSVFHANHVSQNPQRTLASVCHQDVDEADAQACRERRQMITYFRACAYLKAAASAEYENGDIDQVKASRPLDYIIAQQSNMIDPMECDLAADPESIPSWTIFQHRYMIYMAITLKQASLNREEYARLRTHSVGVLRRLCMDVIAKTHPKIAKVILKGVLHSDRLDDAMRY